MAADDELDAEAFAEALAGGEDGRRLLALDALQECDRRGPLPEAVLTPLLECLRSRRKAVQRTAAEVLVMWSRVTPEIRPGLLDRLRDPDLHVRWGAAFALAKIGPEPATLGVLLETLGQSDGDMRWAAQGIVVALARKDPAVRDRLAGLVAAGTPPQRKMAMYCLRDLGEPPPALRDSLIGELAHDDPEVRLAALSALSHLFADDVASAAAVLARVRREPEAGVRRAAVSTLGKLGRGAGRDAEISRALDEAAASEDEGLRRAALGARQKREGSES